MKAVVGYWHKELWQSLAQGGEMRLFQRLVCSSLWDCCGLYFCLLWTDVSSNYCMNSFSV